MRSTKEHGVDRMSRFLRGGCLAALALGLSVAAAQPYPSKPVKAIVPFGVGGNTDAAARIIGAKLAERWGQQVVIENRTGADGNIGTEAAAKAPPDGYTLYFATNTLTINKVMAPSPAFDPMKTQKMDASQMEETQILDRARMEETQILDAKKMETTAILDAAPADNAEVTQRLDDSIWRLQEARRILQKLPKT